MKRVPKASYITRHDASYIKAVALMEALRSLLPNSEDDNMWRLSKCVLQ